MPSHPHFANENALLAACLTGDQEAWELFKQKYEHGTSLAVRKALFRRDRSPDRVDDVNGDLWEGLGTPPYKLLRAFKPRKAKLATYLAMLAQVGGQALLPGARAAQEL